MNKLESNYRAIYHQTLAEIPICLSEFLIGSTFGWVAPMIKVFLENPNSEITATEAECSWMASMSEFGRTFGPIFSLLLLDILGRKYMLQIATGVFFIIWLAILFTRSITILCVTFFIFGLAVGTYTSASAIYIGENSSPNLRAIFCSISTMSFYLGLLVQYIIAGYLPYHGLAVVNLITAFACLVSTLLFIESPQFLMLKGRFNKAEKNMMWLKGTNNKEEIFSEFEIVKSNITSEKLKKASYRELFAASANYRSLMIMLILHIAYAATGNAVLFTYISVLFPPNDYFTSNQVTVFFGISQIGFCLLSSFVIETFNRRTLMLFSFAVFFVCHSTAAYFLYDAANNIAPVSYGIWITLASVCIFSGLSAVVYSAMHMLRGELFPQSIRPIGSGLSTSTHSFTEFLIIKIFLMVKSQYGIHANFLGYAVVSFVVFWFSFAALPETKGKTLIEIQRSLEKRKRRCSVSNDNEEEMKPFK